MKLAFLIILLSTFPMVGCSDSGDFVKRSGQPLYVRSGFDEELMERAMKKAQDTHLEFVTALNSQPTGAGGFAIKKAFGAEKEHIWLNDVSWSNNAFSAVVNNEPVDTKAVKLGDRVSVSPAEISDWMYIENGVLKGGFTIRVVHYSASPAEQKEMLKHVPFSIPAIDF